MTGGSWAASVGFQTIEQSWLGHPLQALFMVVGAAVVGLADANADLSAVRLLPDVDAGPFHVDTSLL